MPRVTAWHCLRSGSPTPLREVDRHCRDRGLDDRDRSLVRHLVGSELRHRGTLRAIVGCFTQKRPKPGLITHLHLGLVQLLYLDRVPDHAAVNSTVSATGETFGPSKGPLINGVLRNVQRDYREGRMDDPRHDLVDRDITFERAIFRDPRKHPYLWGEDALSIPAGLLKRWGNRLGDERAFALGRFFMTEPPLSVRVVRGERAALMEELAEFEPTPGPTEIALVVNSEHVGGLTCSAPFLEGRITIQGATAMAAVDLLGATEGERILDLCSAPGGKTSQLLATGAHVTASDLDEVRLERVIETAQRLGVTDRLTVVASDGTAGLQETEFDGVFVDAPCSNTGVLGARPGARWRFGPQSQASLLELQERLLREAAAVVRPGGRLVWSTCSLEPEENGQLVRAFLTENADFEIEEERESLPDPEAKVFDGGYAGRLRRKA